MKQTNAILMECDGELATSLSELKLSLNSTDEYVVHIPKPNIAITKLLHPIVRSLFIGYLPLQTVLHVWDMITLGTLNI